MTKRQMLRLIAWLTVIFYTVIFLGREFYAYYTHLAQISAFEMQIMGVTPYDYYLKIAIFVVLLLVAAFLEVFDR